MTSAGCFLCYKRHRDNPFGIIYGAVDIGETVVAKKLAISENGSKAISTKEARKILGKDFAGLTDAQIDDLVTKLFLIAKGVIILPESSI